MKTPPTTATQPAAQAAQTSAQAQPTASSRPAKPAPTRTSRPAKPAATGATSSAAVTAPSAPSLDLAGLEQRLKDTSAIGLFTKLSLKNQVDDLLNDLRALYKGPVKQPSPELRQRYDLLLLKVLSLLQEGDPPLAAAISSSKEAIWNILADPEKLAKI